MTRLPSQVEQEQWGAEGVQPPLNHSHYIRYNFNAGCSAGSAPFFVICRITPYLFSRFLPYELVRRAKMNCLHQGSEHLIMSVQNLQSLLYPGNTVIRVKYGKRV